MRTDVIDSPAGYISGTDSPPACATWSTGRRLLGRAPPGAPRKAGRSFPSIYSYNAQRNCTALSTKQRADRILLPSRTIDEDDEDESERCPRVSLSFRPTRLFFDNTARSVVAQKKDPTTVLITPEVPFPWYDEAEDESDDDSALSPRLFRLEQISLPCFVALEVAEADESEDIFRQREELVEARESTADDDDDAKRRCSWAPSMDRNPDGDRG